MKTIRRASLVAFALSILVTGTALAEGSWNSFIAGALTGFDSRQWTDNNVDAANTTVRFTGCSDVLPGNNGQEHTDVAVFRIVPILPDVNHGQKRLTCGGANIGLGNWGRLPGSAQYFFEIKLIHGMASGNQLWVNAVRVAY